MCFWTLNRICLRQGLLWLTPNLALIIQCLLWNFFFFFSLFYIPRKMFSPTQVEDHSPIGSDGEQVYHSGTVGGKGSTWTPAIRVHSFLDTSTAKGNTTNISVGSGKEGQLQGDVDDIDSPWNPCFIKTGSGIRKLIGGGGRFKTYKHTHRTAISHAYFHFWEWEE
jgi:hypothetical protein